MLKRAFRVLWKPTLCVLIILFIICLFIRHHDSNLLVGRPWIDKMPHNSKDEFSLYGFGDTGIHDAGLLARYVAEAFIYEATETEVKMTWLADDKVSTTKYTVVEESHGEFDLKLVLETDPRHNNQQYTYYSKYEWAAASISKISYAKKK